MLLLLFLLPGRSRFVLDVDLVWGKDASNAIDEGEGIVLGPKVNVEGVELVVIFVFVSGIVGG